VLRDIYTVNTDWHRCTVAAWTAVVDVVWSLTGHSVTAVCEVVVEVATGTLESHAVDVPSVCCGSNRWHVAVERDGSRRVLVHRGRVVVQCYVARTVWNKPLRNILYESRYNTTSLSSK